MKTNEIIATAILSRVPNGYGMTDEEAHNYAQAVLTALSDAGMAIVPRNATDKMASSGAAAQRDFYSKNGVYPRTKGIWDVMISAHEKERK